MSTTTQSPPPAPSFESVWAALQETDRLLRERSQDTDRKFQETRQLLDNLSRRFGDLGNRLGEFVEAMVEPAVVSLFRARGLDVSEVHRNIGIQRKGEGFQLDLFVVDGDTAVAVEVKSRLVLMHVQEHIERMNKLKRMMPAYAGYRIHGALGGMVVDADAETLALEAGLWVLVQSGETVKICNNAKFEPKVW